MQAAASARTKLTLDLHCHGPYANEQLVYSAARELLANAVRHVQATELTLRLLQGDDELVLVAEDNGRGFPVTQLADRVARGHIGLASERHRVEAGGGELLITSESARTRVEIRLSRPQP